MSARMMTGCEADGCDFGWRNTPPEYVEDLFPLPNPPGQLLTAEELAAYEARVATVWERRESFTGAVFPCPDCRPEAFRRWANGCWRPGHNAGECELCQEAGVPARRK